jgi:hypothetical protein
MRLLSKPYMPAVLLMACMFLGALFLMSFTKPIPAHIELERLYQAGKVTNPIEAMLMLEKAKAASRPDSLPLYTFAFLVAGLTLSLGKVCTKLSQLCSTQFDVAAETI